jgi:hypothetical protein
MLYEAYGGEAVKKSSVFEWHKRFKKGHENVEYLTEPVKILNECGICCIQTVNQAYCLEILKRLRETVRTKRPELWSNDWILHHDDILSHKALSSSFWPRNRLLKRNIHMCSERLLAVSKNKFFLKGTKISVYWWHTKNVTTALKAIPKQELQQCFQQWQHRWAKCIAVQEECLEGDFSELQVYRYACNKIVSGIS